MFRPIQYFVLTSFLLLFSVSAVLADTDDASELSLGMQEPINIEQAWMENSLFLFANVDNDLSPGHALGLEAQWEAAFEKVWGVELEFPQVLAKEPLFGLGPVALGPLGLSVKRVLGQFGDDDSVWAGLLTLQVGGSYWATPDAHFEEPGSNLTLAGLAGLRYRHLFLQGNYGYNLNVDHGGLSGWILNTALGWSFQSPWVVQFEADYSSNLVVDADDGVSASQWAFIPEIGFQTGDWFFEVGEKLNVTPSGVTLLMVEKNL